MKTDTKDISSAKIIEEIEKEFQLDVNQILGKEINLIEKISTLTNSIEEKLKKLYSSKFPKKCNTCGRTYESRAAYLMETSLFRDGRNNSIIEHNKVQEYRDCVCGSTLLIVTDDRRDNSEFGIARRKLFDICVKKLVEVTGQDQKVVIEKVRELFRTVINKANAAPNEYLKK